MSKPKHLSIKQITKHQSYYRNFVVGCGAFLLAFIVSATFAPVKNSSAETQEIAAKVLNTDTQISITPGQEKVTLNVGQPDPTGTFISGNDTLTAKSTSDSGYQLYVSMDNNHTNGNRLYLNGDEFSGYISGNYNDSTNADIVYPSVAELAPNAWGLTFNETDNNNQVYGSAPLMGNEYLLKTRSTATPIEGDAVPVWYAVKVDTNMVTGTYSGNILYTIIAEASNADLGIPSINPQVGALNDIVTISVPLQSITPNIEQLGTITAKIGNESCNITNTTLGGATVNLTCTVPQLTVGSTYNVSVYIQKYDSTYVAENAFTYTSPTLANITTMQEMTSDICAATATGTKVTLRDTRGGGNAGSQVANYGVVKAADGNCWMTDNLNIYNYTINAETSDFTSPANYTIPAPITDTNQWNSNVYSPATDTSSASPHTGKKVEISHGMGQYASQDQQYWNEPYYNWTVAVAKETTAGVTTAPDTSICPKGWTLPTNGDKGVNKSWAKLLDTYSITTGAQLISNSTLGFTKYYGYWSWGHASELSQGSYGYFWSGTPSAEANAYYLDYVSGGVHPQVNYTKGYGFSIRCVAR
ncbi:hypothetical protein IJI55_01255 [Candidatus Saccharibacteria bacterium]|nr:hypothetical protein [Candidatus Saccharibacteria bacterium]